MNYYALFYEVVDDFVARRTPFRGEHLHLAAEAHDRGEIVLAGALAEPADRALILFYVDDRAKVEAFARKDPYVVNGLVKKWEVRQRLQREQLCDIGLRAPPRRTCPSIWITFPKTSCPICAA